MSVNHVKILDDDEKKVTNSQPAKIGSTPVKILDDNEKKETNSQPAKIGSTPVKSLRHPEADHIVIDGKVSSPYPSTRKLMTAVDASEEIPLEGLRKENNKLKMIIATLSFVLSILSSYILYILYIKK